MAITLAKILKWLFTAPFVLFGLLAVSAGSREDGSSFTVVIGVILLVVAALVWVVMTLVQKALERLRRAELADRAPA